MTTRIIALLLFIGCSRASDPDSFTGAYCGLFTDCCREASRPTDGRSCRALVALSSEGRAYNASAGEECLSALESAKEEADFCMTFGNDPPACDTVFAKEGGGKMPGELCTNDDDCAGEATCFSTFDPGTSSETRTCLIERAGVEGSMPCVGTRRDDLTIYTWDGSDGPAPLEGYVCASADGVHCDGATRACARLKEAGAACLDSDECTEANYCDFSSGTCVATLPIGASCADASTRCGSDAYCASGTSQCTARRAINEACEGGDECLSHSCVNGACGEGFSSLGLSLLCGS